MIPDLLMALAGLIFGVGVAIAARRYREEADYRRMKSVLDEWERSQDRRIQRRADDIGAEVSEWLREPERRP